MSWLWGSSKAKDATADLDPSLRDFLEKETARQQAAEKVTTHAAPQPTSYRAQAGLDVPGIRPDSKASTETPAERTGVPAQSLFQDGRYAHLWKTYRSQAELEMNTQTDQDKMAAIIQNMGDRKAAIGRAALENCVVEQMEQEECWRSGSYSRLVTMCRAETKSFNKCYDMQARFLRALGYLSVPRSDEEEERIQTHADKLYQQMLQREKAQEEAKAAGKTPAPPGPLINAEETIKALGEDSNFARMRADAVADPAMQGGLSMFKPEVQQKIRDSVKDMSEEERALELQLIVAENRVRHAAAKEIAELVHEQEKSREWRKANNKETLPEKIRGWMGSDR